MGKGRKVPIGGRKEGGGPGSGKWRMGVECQQSTETRACTVTHLEPRWGWAWLTRAPEKLEDGALLPRRGPCQKGFCLTDIGEHQQHIFHHLGMKALLAHGDKAI